MSRFSFRTGVAIIALLASVYSFPANAKSSVAEATHAQAQILVQTKPGLEENEFLTLLAKHDAVTDRKVKGANFRIVKVAAGVEKKIAEELSKEPGISFAVVDSKGQGQFVPDDPGYSAQWHHPTINSPGAWDIGQGSSNVVIAVIDSGADTSHPDLIPNIVNGYNWIDGNTNINDTFFHGSATGGIVAAKGNDGYGISGVCPQCKIMPLKVLGNDNIATISNVASAIIYATDHNVKIINMSLAYWGWGDFDVPLRAAAEYAWNHGVLIVASAGNYGDNQLLFPASYDHVLSVAGTDTTNTRVGWSSWGLWIDVAAPAVGVYTTVPGGYGGGTGTSFSSPIVAGLAGLLLSANPRLTAQNLIDIIKNTSTDIDAPGNDVFTGKGVVNAEAAMRLAMTYSGSTPTPTQPTQPTQPTPPPEPPKDTTAPSTSISSPKVGATVGGKVTVNAGASDNVGVTKVELYVNGALYATDTLSSYSFSWDTAPLGSSATATLTVKAYDAEGNSKLSSGALVTVKNIVPDTTAPVVTITQPANGAIVSSSSVTIKAKATDNVKIKRLTIYVDGREVSSDNDTGDSYTWNTRKVASGSHSIKARAEDTSGNISEVLISVRRK